MDCRHLEDSYEVYLLGLVPVEESGDLDAHLARGCPYCLGRLREAAETIYFFMMTLPKGRPDSKWKAELLRRIRRRS